MNEIYTITNIHNSTEIWIFTLVFILFFSLIIFFSKNYTNVSFLKKFSFAVFILFTFKIYVMYTESRYVEDALKYQKNIQIVCGKIKEYRSHHGHGEDFYIDNVYFSPTAYVIKNNIKTDRDMEQQYIKAAYIRVLGRNIIIRLYATNSKCNQ